MELKVEVDHYARKRVELESLLTTAQSRTIRELITEAIDRSEASMKDLAATQQVVILYLNAHNARAKKKLAEYKINLETLHREISKISKVPRTKELYIRVAVLSHASLALQHAIDTDGQLNEIVIGVHSECSQALTDTLLEHIFKYRKDFNIARINDLFNYFLENKIPGLGEMKLVMGLPHNARQQKMVKDGDELPVYLEQYIDVLQRWSHYCSEYMKLLISDPSELIMPD